MTTPLYDEHQGIISPAGVALLAGIDVETIKNIAPLGHPGEAELPAPIVQRMIANTDRIDPDRKFSPYYVIDVLAAEHDLS